MLTTVLSLFLFLTHVLGLMIVAVGKYRRNALNACCVGICTVLGRRGPAMHQTIIENSSAMMTGMP